MGGGAGALSFVQKPSTQSSSCAQSSSVLQGFFGAAGALDAVLAARAFLSPLQARHGWRCTPGSRGTPTCSCSSPRWRALAGVAGVPGRTVGASRHCWHLRATQNSFRARCLQSLSVSHVGSRAAPDAQRDQSPGAPTRAAWHAEMDDAFMWGPPRRQNRTFGRPALSTRPRLKCLPTVAAPPVASPRLRPLRGRPPECPAGLRSMGMAPPPAFRVRDI